MQIINRVLNGKMNTDSEKIRVLPSDYVDALNITRSNKDTPYNLMGNTIVVNPYLHGTGTNKRIGSFEDITRNRVYVFIWNSLGYHLVCYYDAGTDSFVKLIKNKDDSGGEDILQFNPSYRINHVDIIYRDVEGDLISWTDGYSSPKEFNVSLISTYGVIDVAFIEAAKRPPLSVPTATYGDDSTKINNSLRKALPKFRYRWQYDDFTFSTYSPTSVLALPVIVGTDNDLDPTKNNYIIVGVETGKKNVIAIEIIAEQLSAGQWSDFFLVAHLIKADLGIADDGLYNFNFYNDGVYPPVDINEVLLTYDYFPKKAICQALGNGNVKIYAGITEGYPRYPVNQLDVTMTVANVKNTGVDLGLPSLTYVYQPTPPAFVFTVSGTVSVGARYFVEAYVFGVGYMILCDYTAIIGNTVDDVAHGLFLSLPGSYQLSESVNTFQAQLPAGSFIIITHIVGGTSPATISSESVWNYNSKHRFGLAYMDEDGYIIGDVCTFVSPTSTDNDFEINTPNITTNSGTPETPVISAEINHLPPAGAVKYMWVVTKNLTIGDFIYYVTCDFQSDTDYYYFSLENITFFKTNNSNFNYGTAGINSSSRLKVMCSTAAGVYGTDYYTLDFEVLGTVDRQLTSGSSTDIASFVKVRKPLAAPSPAFTANMLVMVYTPVKHVTADNLNVYYEIGEAYDIYEDGGINYHRGMNQDQTALLPATFTFTGGDIYYHSRSIYNTILAGGTAFNYLVMDANYNDFYNSAVNGYGRPQIVNVDAKETFNPTLVRFSQEFQAGTNINGINRFYQLNFDEYDRSFGIIRKLFIEGRRMFVFQQFETGVVPILTQIVKDTSGNPLEANSDILLNKITYPYLGKYGIGDTPESFAYSRGAKYFLDSNRGIAVRISQDGATPLSVVYDMNQFFVDTTEHYGKGLDNGIVPVGETYTGNPTVYGTFDNPNNYYILAFEQIRRYSDPSTLVFSQDAVTLSFFEVRSPMEGFESFLSYHPEGMSVLNNLLISYKDGNLWKHTNPVRNNFYGTQYESYITPCFNDSPNVKKTFETIAYLANSYWTSGTNGDIKTSEYNPQTGMQQESQLKQADYEISEGGYYASFWMDVNSMADAQEALVVGDVLKGFWITVKLRCNSTSYAFLNIPHVGYSPSVKNS